MRIAVITTVWYPLSHADVIVTRWREPFPGDERARWLTPPSRITSVFIEQYPSNDIGRCFCAAHDIPIFGSVREALTGEGTDLIVDAILLIGEHGDYPCNEFGQKLYPRKRLFDEIVSVFRAVDRTVPVFNDKHFSWDFGHSCEMLRTAEDIGIPLYGGSSIPHCPLLPQPAVSAGEKLESAVSLFPGDLDSYGFHAIEFGQSLVEQRFGGETGIFSVRAFSGDRAMESLRTGDVPQDLLRSAFGRHGYPDLGETMEFLWSRAEGVILLQIHHRDGLRVSHLLFPKFVTKWIFAALNSVGQITSCEAMAGSPADFFNNFACLNVMLEKFFLESRPPTPLLRTHLATGALDALQRALVLGGEWLETPQLAISYGVATEGGPGPDPVGTGTRQKVRSLIA